MPRLRAALISCLLLIGSAAASAAAALPASVAAPPLIGQPEEFSGAVGVFEISAVAGRSELPAEEPLDYCIRITSRGPVRQPPRRPNLRQLPRFKKRFVIQDAAALDRTSRSPAGQTWEYHYQLKPRSPEVREVPPFLFVYYKPGVIPREKGYWTTATPAFPLTVTPRSKAVLVDPQGKPVRAPERFYRMNSGPTVLSHEEAFTLPSPSSLVLLGLAPPALSLMWFAAWRRRYPDAGRQARRRKSRAAQTALKALQAIRAVDADTRAKQSALAISVYLGDRFDLAASSSPAELATHLDGADLPSELCRQLADFFRACDAARFAPDQVFQTGDLVADAERLILTLETAWPARTS